MGRRAAQRRERQFRVRQLESCRRRLVPEGRERLGRARPRRQRLGMDVDAVRRLRRFSADAVVSAVLRRFLRRKTLRDEGGVARHASRAHPALVPELVQAELSACLCEVPLLRGVIHARMACMETKIYKAQQFNLSGLEGISDKTLEMHFKLYEGYVKATNDLSARIAAILADGKVDQEEMPAYSELTRRLGFEYNGMVLHEYYFANMKRQSGGEPSKGSSFREAVERSFPSFAIWKTD